MTSWVVYPSAIRYILFQFPLVTSYCFQSFVLIIILLPLFVSTEGVLNKRWLQATWTISMRNAPPRHIKRQLSARGLEVWQSMSWVSPTLMLAMDLCVILWVLRIMRRSYIHRVKSVRGPWWSTINYSPFRLKLKYLSFICVYSVFLMFLY